VDEGKRDFPGTLSFTIPLERILSRDPGEEGPGGFCLLDRLGRILFRTPACERVLKGLSVVPPEGDPRPLEGLLLAQARETTSARPELRRKFAAVTRDGQARIVDCQTTLLPPEDGGEGTILMHVQDMTDLEVLARETLAFGRYQEVLGKIAHLAVKGAGLSEIATVAARETALALDVEFCKILIPGDSDPLLHLLAGVGWRPGLVGSYVQEGGIHSQAGFAIRQKQPVVVEDLLTETRFSPSVLLSEHKVRSGVSVPMMFHDQVLGAMSAHTLSVRRFDQSEIGFLETVANTIATLLERWKREETQLSLFKRLFAQLQDGVILTDTRGVILEWNPAMERMSGWSRREATGRTPRILSSGHQPPEFYDLLWQKLLSGKPFTGRFINRRKDKSEFLVWENISPVMDPDNTIRYFLAILTDLSERERLLEALRQTEQIRLVGQLAGGLLHEIRNPLIGIGSLADHMGQVRDLPDPLRRQAALIASEARRIDELLGAHLSQLRPRSFEFQPIMLEELVRDTQSLLAETFRKRHVRVTLRAEGEIPVVEGARGPLQQVFLNLAMNALDAMANGGGTLDITLFRDDGLGREGVGVTLADSGPGIPASLLKRLNEPFFTHGKARGVGLGLAICRDIVDRHRGRLVIESPEGGGVRATVWIPSRKEGP
jgi:PAS domain S-box-containing protein